MFHNGQIKVFWSVLVSVLIASLSMMGLRNPQSVGEQWNLSIEDKHVSEQLYTFVIKCCYISVWQKNHEI